MRFRNRWIDPRVLQVRMENAHNCLLQKGWRRIGPAENPILTVYEKTDVHGIPHTILAPLQLDQTRDTRGGDQPGPVVPLEPGAARGRGGEVHVLFASHPPRPAARVPRGVPHRRASLRKPPRSGQRDPLGARPQARVRPQGGARDASALLLLLRQLTQS